jgi:CAAX protease family protein
MRDNLKHMFKQLGLGFLNLVAVLVLVFGTQALIHGRVKDVAGLTVLSAIVLLAYLAGSRWIERRQPPELAGFGGIAEFAGGIGLGIALFSSVMGLLWACGAYHPTGPGAAAALGRGGLFALMGAIVEETVARGFLFRLVQTAVGTWIAVLVSSALFGAAHAANPGATWTSSVAIALEAGVLLAAAYAVTGRLWLPIGLHAGWNFAEGSLFGMSVSGLAAHTGLIAGTLQGPVILTGGAFGPEASILAVILCFSVAVLLLWLTVRSGKVIRPGWTRRILDAETSTARIQEGG